MARRNFCASLRPWVVSVCSLFLTTAFGNTNHVENDQATVDQSRALSYWMDTSFANKKVHVLRIDLTSPEIAIRASASTERGLTPSSFASKTDAIAVINGDFFDGAKKPVGLAIGQGVLWPGSLDTKEWSFLACNDKNNCMIEPRDQVSDTRSDWTSAVGGWQVLLEPNFEWTPALDDSCGAFCLTEHPRTAIGLSADKLTMWWVMVEGRQGRLTGLTLSNLTLILKKLGASWGLNLDGGGSSGLVLNGRLMNGRPFNEPQERSVSNCLAIIRK